MAGGLRILGIDPGTHRLGFGVINADRGKLTMLDYGCIEPKTVLDPADRLLVLYEALTKLMLTHQPDAVAVEELFFTKNVTTGIRVAEARGVILLTARMAGGLVYEYKPNVIKQAVAGYGQAEKQQVQKMVKLQLGLTELPKPDDAADGLAVAMCHAFLNRTVRI